MEAGLAHVARFVSLALDAVAILLLGLGTIEAVIGMLRVAIRGGTNHEKRAVWLSFAQWLVASLTVQLASDIVGTTLHATWSELGRVGAIALLRTFLTYSLDRDVERIRTLQHERAATGGP